MKISSTTKFAVIAALLFASIAGVVCAAVTVTAPDTKSAQKTTITSEMLEMISGANENTFYFTKNVVVIGTNLKMKADQMTVTAIRPPEGKNSTATSANIVSMKTPAVGSIDKIVATGSVHIYQGARESISGKAEFFPKEGKVVLTESPRVIDSKAIVSGWRITLFQGERKVMVEQNPDGGGSRPSVNLDSIPNMGFDPAQKPPETAPVPAPIPAATSSSSPQTNSQTGITAPASATSAQNLNIDNTQPPLPASAP